VTAILEAAIVDSLTSPCLNHQVDAIPVVTRLLMESNDLEALTCAAW
jgi:hypothetical protein